MAKTREEAKKHSNVEKKPPPKAVPNSPRKKIGSQDSSTVHGQKTVSDAAEKAAAILPDNDVEEEIIMARKAWSMENNSSRPKNSPEKFERRASPRKSKKRVEERNSISDEELALAIR